LIPHSHQDCGWLKTIDQYFYGQNASIYNVGVQYVYDSVVAALASDPRRRFVAVEMAFFSRWYYQQPLAARAQVQVLVASGQLSFANGGWCMHDEAASHWLSQVEQTTLGHRFLKAEFNVAPTVAWQIDPFGHSATQAALLTAEAGFDALFFGRIDYQVHGIRAACCAL
jgi:alpha-mannosidase